MKVSKRIISIGLIVLALSGTLIGCGDSEEVKQEEANQREQDEFLINYEENSDKRNKGLQFLKEHADEYDRLNIKLGEDRDFDNLTTDGQETYNELVTEMSELDIVEVTYDKENNALTKITDSYRDLSAEIEKKQDRADRKVLADYDGEMENYKKEIESIKKKNNDQEKLLELERKKKALEDAKKYESLDR